MGCSLEPTPEEPGKGNPKTRDFADVDPVATSVLVIALCGVTGAAYAYIRRSNRQIADAAALEDEVISAADED